MEGLRTIITNNKYYLYGIIKIRVYYRYHVKIGDTMDFNLQHNYKADAKLNFDKSNIDQMVIRRGAHVRWEKSYLCTCRTSTGRAKTDCPYCFGTGFTFLPQENTSMMLQSMAKGFKNTQEGLSMSGTALGTTTADDATKISVRDRITFDDMEIAESVLVFVTDKHVRNGLNLRYEIKKINTVLVSPDNKQIKDTENLFNLDSNTFNPIPDMIGKYISINMAVVLRFYVVDILREARYQYKNDPRYFNQETADKDDFTPLPAQVMLRREDMYIPSMLVDDKGNPNNVGPDAINDPIQVINSQNNGFNSLFED